MGILTSKDLSGDQRLQDCSIKDASHVVPGDRGPHVKKIQDALIKVAGQTIDPKELSASSYGPSTARAVEAFKRTQTPPLLNYKREIDPITGVKTITALDKLLKASPKPPPIPPTPPAPMPLPIVGVAGVNVGQLGHGMGTTIVNHYYTHCGRETIGPAQIATAAPGSFGTFEDLIDKLTVKSEVNQVVVNHGSEKFGLIMRFCAESQQSHTGPIMAKLSRLTDARENDQTNTGLSEQHRTLLIDIAKYIRVSPAVVTRIVDKLVILRKKTLILHFRACNMKDSGMVSSYKSTFGAAMITFHGCRMLFLSIKPDRVKDDLTVDEIFINLKDNPKFRTRKFIDPKGLMSSLIIGVIDVDGHAQVRDVSLIEDAKDPAMISKWANVFLGRWNERETFAFTVPVMWPDDQLTYFGPLEDGWRQELDYV